MAIENPFKHMPKWGIYTSIAGGAVIGGYALYEHHKKTGSWSPLASAPSSSTSSVANTAGTITDPTTGTVYTDTAIDPVTNMTYASEISEFGSVATAEADVSAYGTTTTTGSETLDSDYVSAQSQDLTTTISGQNVYTSNSAWSQAVQAGLEDISGSTTYDGTDIGTALGAFLQGEPLTAAQAQLISVAEAEYGKPPQSAPPITLVPTTTTGTTTTTSTEATGTYPAPTGLTVKHTGTGDYLLSWKPIPAGSTYPAPTSYTIAVYKSTGGNAVSYQTVNAPDTTGNVTYTVTGLTTPGTYLAEVWANGTGKMTAPPHATVSIKVT